MHNCLHRNKRKTRCQSSLVEQVAYCISRTRVASWSAVDSAARIPHPTVTHGLEEATVAESTLLTAHVTGRLTTAPQRHTVRRWRGPFLFCTKLVLLDRERTWESNVAYTHRFYLFCVAYLFWFLRFFIFLHCFRQFWIEWQETHIRIPLVSNPSKIIHTEDNAFLILFLRVFRQASSRYIRTHAHWDEPIIRIGGASDGTWVPRSPLDDLFETRDCSGTMWPWTNSRPEQTRTRQTSSNTGGIWTQQHNMIRIIQRNRCGFVSSSFDKQLKNNTNKEKRDSNAALNISIFLWILY